VKFILKSWRKYQVHQYLLSYKFRGSQVSLKQTFQKFPDLLLNILQKLSTAVITGDIQWARERLFRVKK
jgi:hypothetical protein